MLAIVDRTTVDSIQIFQQYVNFDGLHYWASAELQRDERWPFCAIVEIIYAFEAKTNRGSYTTKEFLVNEKYEDKN